MYRRYRRILPKISSTINGSLNRSNFQVPNNLRHYSVLDSNCQVISAHLNNSDNHCSNTSGLQITSAALNYCENLNVLGSLNISGFQVVSAASNNFENGNVTGPSMSGLQVTSAPVKNYENVNNIYNAQGIILSEAVLPKIVQNVDSSASLDSEKPLEKPVPSSASQSINETKTIGPKLNRKNTDVLASDTAIRIVNICEFSRGLTCEDYNFASKNDKEGARTR